MPIKLIPPRPGKTPYYAGRGTHHGIRVDRSTKFSSRDKARKLIKQWEREIEDGVFIERGEPTFASAALAYMQAGGERKFVTPLLKHFKETPLKLIDQKAIDKAAATLYPTATAATRNRQVYTPVSAILKRAGLRDKLTRPIGSRGRIKTDWLNLEQASRIFSAADGLDAEFGLFLRVLCYTGLRLSEGLRPKCEHLDFERQEMFVGRTKNGKPRTAFLPNHLIVALANHPRGVNRNGQRVFRFHAGGALRYLLNAACAIASGLQKPKRWKRQKEKPEIPPHELDWVTFHTFCHTWATWMCREGGLDIKGLVDTGRWSDPQSAARYAHAVAGEASARANLLPPPIDCGKTAERRRNLV